MGGKSKGEEGLKTPQGPPSWPPHPGDGRKRRRVGSGLRDKASPNRKLVSAQGFGKTVSSTPRCWSPPRVPTWPPLCVCVWVLISSHKETGRIGSRPPRKTSF